MKAGTRFEVRGSRFEEKRVARRLLAALFWLGLFLLMATRLPAESPGDDMTAEVDRAEVLSRQGR